MFKVLRVKQQGNFRKTGTPPLWLESGEYTFTKANKSKSLETDGFNAVSQGRPADMLDDDNVAWSKPIKPRKPKQARTNRKRYAFLRWRLAGSKTNSV